MILGRVVGTIVATQKDEKLQGTKLLVVRHLGMDLSPKDSYLVAVDTVGAGFGEVVLCVTGSSARFTKFTRDKPVDAAIMAIVDQLEIEGEVRYSKHRGT
ncbi:MAG TPA: ethanolamine utilization protein EutN [Candidatus Latescibacteria bacterium]|nr:ethanolamine utilization protein EutN [Candidatus Latescibacterota bacterium]